MNYWPPKLHWRMLMPELFKFSTLYRAFFWVNHPRNSHRYLKEIMPYFVHPDTFSASRTNDHFWYLFYLSNSWRCKFPKIPSEFWVTELEVPYCWWFWNPVNSPVEVGTFFYLAIYKVFFKYIQTQVVSRISSINQNQITNVPFLEIAGLMIRAYEIALVSLKA